MMLPELPLENPRSLFEMSGWCHQKIQNVICFCVNQPLFQ